jgi:hypothetical protein
MDIKTSGIADVRQQLIRNHRSEAMAWLRSGQGAATEGL